jgi:anion-transporting  ArsA/GET3 family ATPase
MIAHLVKEKKIILCCGSGGVGKTTTSAALGMLAAQQGSKVLVCTIDPAKRLANALGLEGIGHDPVRIDPARYGGRGRGELYAMMLEPKRSFDAVIEKFAPDEATKQRLYQNKIYTSLAGTLAGSQEHGAIQKLYELDQSGKYDLIVLDTPPTQNAIDFLDAPKKMVEAIDSPAIEWFLKPFQKTGSFSLKVLNISASFILKNIGRFTGMGFLEKVAEFFLDFQHLTAGFREGARKIYERLHADDVAFVLVSSPEPLAIAEILYFYERLRDANMNLAAFVINRTRQAIGDASKTSTELLSKAAYDAIRSAAALSSVSEQHKQELARVLGHNLAERNLLAAADAHQLQLLEKKISKSVPILCLPQFDVDVHDTESLRNIVDLLLMGGVAR